MLSIIDCQQGTPEWIQARLGIVTCSELKSALGSTATSYMYKLIAEIVTGAGTNNFSNAHTERGHELEPHVRSLYEFEEGVIVSEVGFMRFDGEFGALGYSPDGLVDDHGLVELKTRLPHLQAKVLVDNKLPSEHEAQVQGGLLVSGRAWCDYVSYCPGMRLFKLRVFPDAEFHQEIKDKLTGFYENLAKKLEKVRGNA